MNIPLQFDSFSQPQSSDLGTLLHPISWELNAVDFSEWLTSPSPGASLQSAPSSSMVLAQQFDQDILGDIAAAWKVFVESGQIWALLVGIVIGYLIRNLTAY